MWLNGKQLQEVKAEAVMEVWMQCSEGSWQWAGEQCAVTTA